MATLRRAKVVDVALGFSLGLFGMLVLAWVRFSDFERGVKSVALEIEERYFEGDVAGAFSTADDDE